MLLLLTALPVLAETQSCAGIQAKIHDSERVDPGYLFWHQSDELKMDVDNNYSATVGGDWQKDHTYLTFLREASSTGVHC